MDTRTRLNWAKSILKALGSILMLAGGLIALNGILLRDFDGIMPPGHHFETMTDQLILLRDWWLIVTIGGGVLCLLGALFLSLRPLFRPVMETVDYELLTIAITREFEHILAGFVHNLKYDLHQVKGISEETVALLAHAPHLCAVVDRVRGDIARATLGDLSALIEEIEVARAELPSLQQRLVEYRANLEKVESMVNTLSDYVAHLKTKTSTANERRDTLAADISRLVTDLAALGFATGQGASVITLRGGAG